MSQKGTVMCFVWLFDHTAYFTW